VEPAPRGDHHVDDELAPLQWVRRLASGDQDRIAAAWDAAMEQLAGDNDNISLAYPAGYHGGQEISRFDPDGAEAGTVPCSRRQSRSSTRSRGDAA